MIDIDWTLYAQLINFLLLVYLLNVVLFRPIRTIIKERQAKLLAEERDKQAAQQSEARRLQVGSGDRSERIRTYNYPQGRVTDHRINLTLYRLESVLQGNLDELIDPLINEHQTKMLAALGE